MEFFKNKKKNFPWKKSQGNKCLDQQTDKEINVAVNLIVNSIRHCLSDCQNKKKMINGDYHVILIKQSVVLSN